MSSGINCPMSHWSEIIHFLILIHFKTRLHSSRMHTARLLTVPPSMHCAGGTCPGGCLPGGACLGVCLPGGCLPRWGVPCDLSHHVFDVTCMLPPHQLRPTNSAAAYILLVGHVTCKACWATTPPLVNRILDTRFWKYYLAPNMTQNETRNHWT